VKKCYQTCAAEIGCKHPYWFDKSIKGRERLYHFHQASTSIRSQLERIIVSYIPLDTITANSRVTRQRSRSPPKGESYELDLTDETRVSVARRDAKSESVVRPGRQSSLRASSGPRRSIGEPSIPRQPMHSLRHSQTDLPLPFRGPEPPKMAVEHDVDTVPERQVSSSPADLQVASQTEKRKSGTRTSVAVSVQPLASLAASSADDTGVAGTLRETMHHASQMIQSSRKPPRQRKAKRPEVLPEPPAAEVEPPQSEEEDDEEGEECEEGDDSEEGGEEQEEGAEAEDDQDAEEEE
jgi:hypothetical protein